MMYNAAILEAAGRHLDVKEWPGAKSNPIIDGFFAGAGHAGLKDDVPWCAAFVGSVLAEVGHPNTNSLLARSYLDWGTKVPTSQVQAGDVVIVKRGAPPSGHVGFAVRVEGDHILLRGGNQGDKVSDAWINVGTVLGVRRADGGGVHKGRPTVQMGDRGAFVTDLQDQLQTLGYAVGDVDGSFGQLTRAAVLAFQADNDMSTDGVVGPRTWEALGSAKPRAKREVSMADLRERGSTTVAAADKAQIGTAITAVTSTAAVVTAQVKDTVSQAQGILPVLHQYWPAVLVVGLGIAVWFFLQQVKNARLRDAQEARNIGL